MNNVAHHNIMLPSKPRLVEESEFRGIYEIDNLHQGFGFTLGNSLRRIILSSLEGAAVTSVKIAGVPHEFDLIEGIKEDVLTILLNLKLVRFKLIGDEAQTVTLSVSKAGQVFAKSIETPGQVEVLNPDQYICEITGKANLEIEMKIEKGTGFVPREAREKGKLEIGHIALDATFTPIRRVAYEVEDMRVGDKTNFNRLRFIIETDGTISPRLALESSIEILILQLQAIHDFKGMDEKPEELIEAVAKEVEEIETANKEESGTQMSEEDTNEIMKTRIDTFNLSTRTMNALNNAKIRTVGGLARKSETDLLEIEGLGDKGVQEIRRALSAYGILLK